jgi:cytochrome c peroxidase
MAVVTLAACNDVPTDPYQGLEPVPAFAKGGNKPNPPPSGQGIVDLGAMLFADKSLSLNEDQSCKTCHEPSQGFAAPLAGVTTQGSVVEGSIPDAFGDRKPPSAAYATVAPNFAFSGNNAVGGNFWDGRATGKLLGNPSADQALGPFLNPKEQAMPDKGCVVWRVATGDYAAAFEGVWEVAFSTISWPVEVEMICTGKTVSDLDLGEDRALVDQQYDNVAISIAAFEASLNTFDSDFDLGELTPQQEQGEQLFGGKGKCQQCHDNQGSKPLFTDFEFHNLGVPLNPDNPVHNYTSRTFDPGLGGFTGRAAHFGKFKTPTVRNVGMGDNRTFMHNGALVSLRQVVQFYNTRDALPVCTGEALNHPSQWGPVPDGVGCWPPPEYPENLDTKRMGNLGLTSDEVDAIVAFMEALSSQIAIS